MKLRKTIRIEAPPAVVYEFMTTPQNLPAISRGLVRVSNVERSPNGAHSCDWVFDMAGLRFDGHWDTVEVEAQRRVAVRTDGGIRGTLDFARSPGELSTEVTLDVEYEMPQRVSECLAEPIACGLTESEADALLYNLKAQLELRKAG